MKILFVLFFALLTNDEQVDFAPKQLFRDLKKISGCEKPEYIELKSSRNLPLAVSKGKFFEYRNATPIKYAYIGRVNTCRAEGCASPNSADADDRSEFFDYYILFDSSANILSVHIFNYEATHGQEITVRGWLKQFVGFNAKRELVVGKDIDAISGATISVHNINYDIFDKTSMLKRYVNSTSTELKK